MPENKPFDKPSSQLPKKVESKEVVKDKVVSAPMENLISEAKSRNAELTVKSQNLDRPIQQNQDPEIKLKKIKSVLIDGGMDSMSQSKAMAKIREILS